jgi:hypothetical protein
MKHAVALLAVCILTSSATAEPAKDEWDAAGLVSIHNISGKVADFANPDTWQKASAWQEAPKSTAGAFPAAPATGVAPTSVAPDDLSAWAVANPPTYETDQSADRWPTALKHLCSSCGDCHKAQDEGKVVQRDFDGGGLLIKGFVLEHKDGSRSYMNVSIENDFLDIGSPRYMGWADSGWIYSGLQTLLKEGREVELTVMICGTGVLDVDEIR